jgi:hypothetical protein
LIVTWAKDGVNHRAEMTYAEIRPMPSINNAAGNYHWTGDCSSWVTQVYKWAGAPDPMGNAYNGYGNTQTLTGRGRQISLGNVRPGDVVVYDAFGPLSNQHTAIVVEAGPDPLCSSMGKQGDPHLVHVSEDGRPPTYLRFVTTIPDPPVKPHSVAAVLGQGARPAGNPPLLVPQGTNPQPWVVYERRLGRVLGYWPWYWPVSLGGYGARSQNLTVKLKRHFDIPLNGDIGDRKCGDRVWSACGVS